MSEPDVVEIPTRRDIVKSGGAVVVGSLLAGCASDSGPGGTATPSETGTDTATPQTATEYDYSVRMAPMGKVEFSEVPQDVFTILGHHVDMLLALGRGDDINAMHGPGYHQALYEKLVAHFEGVSVDWEGLYSSWPPTKEKLYELDSDVHIADPAKVTTGEGWNDSDVQEIVKNVAPWFGNTLSGTNRTPPESWADRYKYYTLWEIFGKIAQVFQAQDRYAALVSIHDSVLQTIEENLPPTYDRPTAALVLLSADEDSGWGYKLNYPGYYAAHTRPMGAEDALANAVGEGYGDDGRNITLDYELLLEADPDVLLVLGPMTESYNLDEIRQRLENDNAASELTAVQEEQVYAQGARRQGPILNLFQLEMTAKQLYPDQFGDWPGYINGEPYPKIPTEEQLFDRQRVADIVTGEFSE